jgi:hypothetical protein
MLNTVLTTACHSILSRVRGKQSTPSQSIWLRSVLILSSHLYLCISGHFPLQVLWLNCCMPFFMLATWFVHTTFLDLTTKFVFREEQATNYDAPRVFTFAFCHAPSLYLFFWGQNMAMSFFGYEVLRLKTMKGMIFYIATPQFGKLNRRFGGTYSLQLQNLRVRQPWVLAACLLLVSCLADSSILKMETIRSTETSVDFLWTTQSYKPGIKTDVRHGYILSLFTL